MWFGQEAIRSMPSTWMRSRSSARPCIEGRLDTPPAPLRLTPGMSCSRRAVSLVAARCGCRLAGPTGVAPGSVAWLARTVTAGRVLMAVSCASAWLHSRLSAGMASAMARWRWDGRSAVMGNPCC